MHLFPTGRRELGASHGKVGGELVLAGLKSKGVAVRMQR